MWFTSTQTEMFVLIIYIEIVNKKAGYFHCLNVKQKILHFFGKIWVNSAHTKVKEAQNKRKIADRQMDKHNTKTLNQPPPWKGKSYFTELNFFWKQSISQVIHKYQYVLISDCKFNRRVSSIDSMIFNQESNFIDWPFNHKNQTHTKKKIHCTSVRFLFSRRAEPL